MDDASYFTQIVLSTRPEGSDAAFREVLHGRGLKVLHMPMIEIAPPETWEELDKAINALSVYSGILFTSVNGVGYFMKRLEELGVSKDELPVAHAVGEKTAAALKDYGLEPEVIAESGGGAELADALGDVNNQYYLHPTSDKALKVMAETVSKRGGKVNTVTAYRTVRPEYNDVRAIDEQLIMGEIDAIAFFSPSAVQNFKAIIPEFRQATVLIGTIGQTTALAATAAGLRVDVIAPEQTAESLATAIADRFLSDEQIEYNDGEIVDLT